MFVALMTRFNDLTEHRVAFAFLTINDHMNFEYVSNLSLAVAWLDRRTLTNGDINQTISGLILVINYKLIVVI